MERDETLCFTPVDHPDARVQRIGFELTDPYVEQCWSAVVGPSSTLLLRRLPTLWVTRVPAEIGASELSRSLGLGSSVSERSRLVNTLNRLVRYRLATPAADGPGLDVYRHVAPLSGHQLARTPGWTQDTHEHLFGKHLEQLDQVSRNREPVAPVRTQVDRIHHDKTVVDNGLRPSGLGLG